jgi:anti-anti-sigma regulatory factor
MQIEAFEHEDRLVCILSGKFGFTAYAAFESMLARIAASSARTIAVDLSATTFIDSAALGMLRVARDEAERMGRHFEITGATGNVAHILKLAEFYNRQGERHDDTRLLVLSDGPPGAVLETECTALGLVAAARDGADPHVHAAVYYGEALPDDVHAGLSPPHRGFFERGADGVAGVGKRCLDAVRAGGAAISVSTATAWRLDLPHLIETAVRQRFPLGKRASDGLVSLCLAEAVSNAVIHGNLGIASGMRDTREGLAAFHRQTSERLADPALAARRVEVSLHPMEPATFAVAVSDRGTGFDAAAAGAHAIGPGDKQGRGLFLITRSARSVAVEDGGRTIVMSF